MMKVYQHYALNNKKDTMQIDYNTYQIKEINRYKTQIAKTQIILGLSLRKDSNHIIRLQHKDFGKTKKWNTFTVSREGVVYQHYDPKYHTDFMGIKDVDKNSISILLENMGCLFKTQDDKYMNWLNEYCDESNVSERTWLGYNYWEKISDEQMLSVCQLCDSLSNEFNIPKTIIEFHYYHKEIKKFRGITFRSNYTEDSNDINPFLDIEKINKLLHT